MLTPEEERVIVHKGTERPFSGEYENYYFDGVYCCKQCGQQLFDSTTKFDAGCGWQSFDDAIAGTVNRTLDADKVRTEITCRVCGWHLGHVFVGEQATEKNSRYCVNSISMIFKPREETKPDTRQLETIVLWGWCFRCVEAVFETIEGVVETKPGYMGGKRLYPSYEQVCAWASGHIEVVQIIYDPAIVSLTRLLEIFFTIHDGTSRDRQGNDAWPQYRSAIFYHSEEQRKIAQQMIDGLTETNKYGWPIVTELKPAETFWVAEGYHHHYFRDNPTRAYCQMVIRPKLDKIKH